MTDDSEELAAALQQLDAETAEGLRDLAENNPELLRETLSDLGYLPTINQESQAAEKSVDLPDAQRRLADALQEMGSPRTAEEVVDLIQHEFPEIVDEFQSAKHRPWMSTQLNELVERGLIGRFRDGRTVRYTFKPTEAVRHWALHNNRFVEDLERGTAREIADDTGMPVRTVREAIDEITEESD